MKKLILSIFILSSITSNIYANDLISIATNGIYNKDFLGVKELNDEEMKRVVGGAYLLRTDRPYVDYGVVNNSGTRISYTAYYALGESYINEFRMFGVDDGSGRYKPAIKVTYNFLNGSVGRYELIGVNKYNVVYTRYPQGYYELPRNMESLKREINRVIRSHASRMTNGALNQ
ncbi:hypothetical protein [Helicobacter sp. WB40]|uniref:hypothetical protein n=1 Tax=Helicobacter sp. WB40 TaxID=3004130 RepID=UPI0022EBAE4F|nr:hypothetical protein [Helicobacter sp. WB40]MDA3967085.1 hypothetical protein [Helicobacter sp. WB40]